MIEDDSGIKRLEALTPHLPVVPTGTVNVSYAVEKGSCLGIGLYRETGIGVQVFYMPRGSVFPSHRHDVREWLIVYRGQLRVTLGVDKPSVIEAVVVSHVLIDINVPHVIEALEDTEGIAITIPVDKGYPDARK
jgi:quercetin dioxygenase-like cupin family protein